MSSCIESTAISPMRLFKRPASSPTRSQQIEAVLGREPDVVALQELTVASYPQWCAALLDAGFSVVSTVDLVGVP